MKRSIIALGLILVLVLSLSSCFGGNKVEEAYKTLNELVTKLDENYNLSTVITSPDGHVVTESYTFHGENVLYRVERLNGFTSNGDGYEAPNEYKDVTERFLTPEEIAQLPAVPAFNFSSKSLSNGEVLEASLTADITNTTEFMGVKLDGKDIELTVFYNDSAISSIIINYTSNNGNNVVITYEFK